MPSKHMLPKGQRRHSVRAAYRATRGVEPPAPPDIPTIELPIVPAKGALAARRIVPPVSGEAAASDSSGPTPPGETAFTVPPEALGMRLDQYLAQAIPELSRSRVQLLIEQGKVLLGEAPVRARHKVTPGEQIRLTGRPQPAALAAVPEAIALHMVYEDQYLAVVNKPAGMAVHAGATAPGAGDDDELGGPDHEVPKDGFETSPATRDPRSGGTLVNALLHHFGQDALSQAGGDLRPGIVHRLDKQTSGLLVVAKDDLTHRHLGELFSARAVHKTYLALVHGHLAPAPRRRPTDPEPPITVSLPIGRDLVRRIRMTTRRPAGAPGVRSAVSHVHVVERLATPFGPFTLVRVTIETGRTHQIRVHLQALGHPVVGDTVYGAARVLTEIPSSGSPAVQRARTRPQSQKAARPGGAAAVAPPRTLSLPRNFLHAAELRFTHPRTGEELALTAPLATELQDFLSKLRGPAIAGATVKSGL